MESKPESKWICENEKVLLHSPFMQFIEQECRSSEDETKKYRFYLLRSRDWSNIIPVTEDGKIVLVRQYRIGVAKHTLEMPGGVSDGTHEDIQATAIREMTEETGYVPLPGAKCVALGWNYPNPAIMDNRQHSFVVGPVRREKAQVLDPQEMIEVVEVPIEEIPGLIARKEINHALMLNAFFFLMMQSTDGKDSLIRELKGFSR